MLAAVPGKPALLKAIEVCKTQTELARRIGGKVKTGHIYHWLNHGVPPERCPAIERATGGKVTRYEIRPDVFGTQPPVLAPARAG